MLYHTIYHVHLRPHLYIVVGTQALINKNKFLARCQCVQLLWRPPSLTLTRLIKLQGLWRLQLGLCAKTFNPHCALAGADGCNLCTLTPNRENSKNIKKIRKTKTIITTACREPENRTLDPKAAWTAATCSLSVQSQMRTGYPTSILHMSECEAYVGVSGSECEREVKIGLLLMFYGYIRLALHVVQCGPAFNCFTFCCLFFCHCHVGVCESCYPSLCLCVCVLCLFVASNEDQSRPAY